MFNSIKYIDMNNKRVFNNNTNNIILISAFFDINRSSWNSIYNRSPECYIDSFKNYINMGYKMIVFIDEKYFHLFQKNCNITFICINEEWLQNNSVSWKQFDIANNIMNSDSYCNLLKLRISNKHPENIYPKYNIINHAKIDFIHYAITNNLIPDNTFICWSDFGYYNSILNNNPNKFPTYLLDINKLNVNKLNFCLRNTLIDSDNDVINTLVNARETFTGSFFGGPIDKMLELYDLYHFCLNDLYNKNISDDDQHVYLRCFINKPELFELFVTNAEWPTALTYFQHSFKNREELIKYHIKDIQNGVFVEIGVCYGTLSKFILNENSTCKLFCIDPYINYNDYNDSCNDFVGDKLFNSVKNELTHQFNDRVEMIRKFANKSMELTPDNLDFVYIDGNHKYSYVFEDITLWYNKLKYGGFIICDDAVDTDDMLRDEHGDVFIMWSPNCSGKYGVIKACKNFCKQNNIIYYKIDNQILFFKPMKF